MIARTRRRTVSLLCLGVLVLIALVPRDTAAQVLYGSVVGDVKDATGGALPGATLVITNTDRGLSREAVTDAAGHFTFSNLPAGVYSLKASQQGFKGFEQKEVTVTINAVTRVDVTLEIGAMGETMTVTAERAEAPDRHGRGARHPGRAGAGECAGAPGPQLPADVPDCCQALRPRSTRTPSRAIRRDPSSSRSTGRATTRTTRASTASAPHNVQLPHVSSYVPTLEAIEEVNVVTSSMGAEQGLAGGAAINVRTKSGSNAFHGSGFEYFTNQDLKAWPMRFGDAALNTGKKPEASYNQYGGTFGGRIVENKAFFFVSYEGTRDHRVVDRTDDGTDAVDASGRLFRVRFADLRSAHRECGRHRADAVPGVSRRPELRAVQHRDESECLNIIPAARMDPIAQQIASHIPANNIDRASRNYFAQAPFQSDRRQVDTKIDYNVNSKFNLAGTFGILHFKTSVPTVFGEEAIGQPIGGSSNPGHGHGNIYRTTVMGTYIFSPTFLMDAHFGFAKQVTNSEQPGLGTNIGSDVLGIPGTNGSRLFESGWPTFAVRRTSPRSA